MSIEIPQALKGYITEIAEKMKNNRAALMVGAGFSENAEKTMPTDKGFLDWNGLGDVFFEKVFGRKPIESDKYVSVLKLAEEVEAAYGRTVLDQIIKDSLPDKEYSPSNLHRKLLNLNWSDVFTTNYDTLLERAQNDLPYKHYEVILNKEDLVYSRPPRIVKLHGSFPSTRPFVITEEDYRKYPSESAAFVNSVQQALIENVLCLIGFSGDDPNFLQWIGWIRDNIGHSIASKIYLVGVFNFTAAEIKMLEKRNITVLNMNLCKDVAGNHYKGIDTFLNLLQEMTKNPIDSWPKKAESNLYFHFDKADDTKSKCLDKIYDLWCDNRINYPGWTITPNKKRELLYRTIVGKHLVLSEVIKLKDSEFCIRFFYEYNWIISRCLMPIPKYNIKNYEQIIETANPFTDNSKLNNESQKAKSIWIDLKLSLLQCYRENGMEDKWIAAKTELESLVIYFDNAQNSNFHYELAMHSLFTFDVNGVYAQIAIWERTIPQVQWELKRAGLLFEIGKNEEAKKIVEDELIFIRSCMNGIDIDYRLFSQEAYAMVLLSYIEQSIDFRNYKKDKSSMERLKNLKIYDCDPYTELEIFEYKLQEQAPEKYERPQFDLRKVTRTLVATANNNYEFALQYWRFLEEIGTPISNNHIVFGKAAAIEATKRINNINLHLSLVISVKINDKKVIEKIWNRTLLFQLTNNDVEPLIHICISSIRDNIEIISQSDRWVTSNFALGIAGVMPELLSRLCTKASNETKIKLLKLLDQMYNTTNILNFVNLNNFTNRLIDSFSEELKIKYFDLIFNLPLYLPQSDIEDREIMEPFHYFSFRARNMKEFKLSEKSKSKIDEIIDKLSDNKSSLRAILRLHTVYQMGLMTKNQIKKFGNKFWNGYEKSEIPDIQNYYHKFSLTLPAPENIDVKDRVKSYILSIGIYSLDNTFSTSKNKNLSAMLYEIIHCTRSDEFKLGIIWDYDDIELIIDKIISAWSNDKQFLNGYKNNISFQINKEIFEPYLHVDEAILKMVMSANNGELNASAKKKIKSLYTELSSNNIPCVGLTILLDEENTALKNIISKLYSNSNQETVNACIASELYYYYNGYDNILKIAKEMSFLIKARKQIGQSSLMISMHNLIYNNLPYNDMIVENLITALTYLRIETHAEYIEDMNDIDNLLIIRKTAMRLAYIMHEKYSSNKKVREETKRWKDISEDLNEFSDIRNQWM